MKNPNTLRTLALCAFCVLGTLTARSQSIETMPAVVVKTLPESGAQDVSPGTYEIKVTYSKPMTDKTWSWSSAWENSTPESLDKPHYDSDRKTCVMKVKLLPGKTYAFWLNSDKFKNFRDAQGHPAVPYLLIFKTKSE